MDPLPEDVPLEVQGGHHHLVVDVAGRENPPVGQRHACITVADPFGFPHEFRPILGPGVEQIFFARNIGPVRTTKSRPEWRFGKRIGTTDRETEQDDRHGDKKSV